jgi:hypothetical protein
MQDVLKAVMGVDNQPFGILRISSSSSHLSGRLAIADGAYIVGATVTAVVNPEDVQTGYSAVRQLLSAKDGNFAFLDTAGNPPADMDGTLFLSIDRLVESMPQLPEDCSALFDEESLLDKIFGPDDKPQGTGTLEITRKTRVPNQSGEFGRIRIPGTFSQPGAMGDMEPAIQDWAPVTESDREAGAPKPTIEPKHSRGQSPISRKGGNGQGKESGQSAHNPNWRVFQPLISNSAITDPSAKQQQLDFSFDIDQLGTSKQSINRMREIPDEKEPWYKELFRESLFSRTSLIWIGAILILSLVATLFATASVNQRNSLTIQRSGNTRSQ